MSDNITAVPGVGRKPPKPEGSRALISEGCCPAGSWERKSYPMDTQFRSPRHRLSSRPRSSWAARAKRRHGRPARSTGPTTRSMPFSPRATRRRTARFIAWSGTAKLPVRAVHARAAGRSPRPSETIMQRSLEAVTRHRAQGTLYGPDGKVSETVLDDLERGRLLGAVDRPSVRRRGSTVCRVLRGS